jgi:hypothetical protein
VRVSAIFRPFTVFGGMAVRRGELLALPWRQLDLERGLVHLAADTTKTARARTLPALEGIETHPVGGANGLSRTAALL